MTQLIDAMAKRLCPYTAVANCDGQGCEACRRAAQVAIRTMREDEKARAMTELRSLVRYMAVLIVACVAAVCVTLATVKAVIG